MTLTLEVPEAVAQQLENEAQQLRVTPQQLAIMKLQRDFEAPTTLSDDEFEKLAREVVRDNREVLERLA